MKGGFVQKKRNRWYPVIDNGRDADGKRLFVYHPGHTERVDAEEALTILLADRQRGIYTEPKKITFGDFVTDVWTPALDVALSTASSYRRNLALHVVPTVGHVRLQAIDAPMLTALYRELAATGRRDSKEGGLSPRTVRYIATIVHRVFGDALAWQYVARNVADAARPPSARRARDAAPEMTTWKGPELGAFLTWVRDDRYGPAFAFLATTGMRRGEALGLRWDDIDLDGGTAAIRRASIAIDHKPVVGATKSGRSRQIELDRMTVAILRQQWSRQAQERLLVGEGYSNDNLLFCLPGGRGFHPERFSREFDRKQATYNRLHPLAPLPRLRLHDLRHTWATLALVAGVHPKVVAERLGHSSTNVTLNTYSHVTKAMASNAAENVAAMIFGNGA
jgi:integrase